MFKLWNVVFCCFWFCRKSRSIVIIVVVDFVYLMRVVIEWLFCLLNVFGVGMYGVKNIKCMCVIVGLFVSLFLLFVFVVVFVYNFKRNVNIACCFVVDVFLWNILFVCVIVFLNVIILFFVCFMCIIVIFCLIFVFSFFVDASFNKFIASSFVCFFVDYFMYVVFIFYFFWLIFLYDFIIVFIIIVIVFIFCIVCVVFASSSFAFRAKIVA